MMLFFNKGENMRKNLPIILLIMIAIALSGCTGSDTSKKTPPIEVQKFELANPELNGKIVDVKFDRDDVIAGEKVAAELLIANTGSEKITKESVEIKVKVKKLDDSLANIYLKTMSEEKKTRTLDPIDFDSEIEPGTMKPISAVFQTIKEMEGRSLAGSYDVTLTLSVNGQKVEARVLPITLKSGTPREFTPTPVKEPEPSPVTTLVPAPVSTPQLKETTPLPEITETPAPTPTPLPEVMATPNGKIRGTRIRADKFQESLIEIDAGTKVVWDNYDVLTSLKYNITEFDGKIPILVLPEAKRVDYTFNVTGDYKFGLYYRNMNGKQPSVQTIRVRVNASQ